MKETILHTAFMTIGFLSLSVSATPKVEHLFQDAAGNSYVVFKYDPNMPSNTYWGNVKTGELKPVGLRGGSSSYSAKGYSFTGTLEAPSAADPHRILEVSGDSASHLKIRCTNAEVCLSAATPQSLEAFSQKITNGSLRLADAPPTRKPGKVYKFLRGNEYVYIDYPKDYRNDSQIKAFKGQPGNMKPIEISQVQHFRDGGTAIYTFEDGSVLRSPSPFNDDPSTFRVAGGEPRRVERLEGTPELLDQLGFDQARFAVQPISADCERLARGLVD